MSERIPTCVRIAAKLAARQRASEAAKGMKRNGHRLEVYCLTYAHFLRKYEERWVYINANLKT